MLVGIHKVMTTQARLIHVEAILIEILRQEAHLTRCCRESVEHEHRPVHRLALFVQEIVRCCSLSLLRIPGNRLHKLIHLMFRLPQSKQSYKR